MYGNEGKVETGNEYKEGKQISLHVFASSTEKRSCSSDL